MAVASLFQTTLKWIYTHLHEHTDGISFAFSRVRGLMRPFAAL